jgi:crotonobetainyl-CoA:carnitine CoA-transferase CaiB-like acyl-CoA transferase
MIGRPELKDDPRFDPEQRAAHMEELEAIVLEYTLAHTKAEIFDQAQLHRLTWGPVSTVADLLRDPHLQARDYFVQIDHPETGPAPYPGAAFQLSEAAAQFERAPLLGEHNTEIYSERLGLSASELVALREAGVI